MMSRIRGKNTRPELALRRAMHGRGFRFRVHGRKLPGRPDIVFPKYGAVVLVHGCFWHRHQGCRFATVPSTRPDFWQAKFDANIARDTKQEAQLREAGWRVAIVWECALKSSVEQVTTDLAEWLIGDSRTLEIPIGENHLPPPP